MNDEIPTGWKIGVCLTWAALLAAHMWVGSWEKIFNAIGMFFGLGILGVFLFIVFVLLMGPAAESIAMKDGINKFDKRLDEIVGKIKDDNRNFERCRNAIERLESAVEELREAMKQDSKTMAKDSVSDAAEEILKTL